VKSLVSVDFCDPDESVVGLPGSHPQPQEGQHHTAEAVLDPPPINTKAARVKRLGHAPSMLQTKLQIGFCLMEV